MKYKVIFSDGALKQLKKIDRHIATLIIGWIEKNLNGTTNPRQFGKALMGNKAGQWRYRIGEYRVICKIIDKQVTILVLEIGHRRNVYENY